MGAFTVTATPKSFCNLNGSMKMAVVEITGPASYDTGGSAVDLSTSGNLGAALGFQKVFGASLMDCDTAASSKYFGAFLHATDFAAASGKLKLHDQAAAADAEVTAATDLSATKWLILVVGT